MSNTDYPPLRYHIDQQFPDNKIPFAADIHYADSYSDYSFGCFLIVYEHQGKFYYINDDDTYQPHQITADEALAMMVDFEDIGVV
jgi:hypothetical protein